GEEVAFAGREDDGLRPARPRFLARRGQVVSVILLDGDKVLALNDLRKELAGTGADLRAFDGSLGSLAVNQVMEKVGKVAGEPLAVGFVAAGLHDPVDDIQTEALIAEAGLLVE